MQTIHDLTLERFRPTADITKRYYNGRKIAFWGEAADLRELLKRDYDIDVDLLVTGVKENVAKGMALLEDMRNKAQDYYIVVPFLKSQANLKQRLVSLGYLEFKDFIFTNHEKVILPPIR